MTFKVIVQPEANCEIDDIFTYIAADSPANAVRWLDRLLDEIHKLERYPRRCPLAPEDVYFDPEIRQFIYGRYRVIFTIDGKTVRVLHVRHSARRAIGEEAGEEK